MRNYGILLEKVLWDVESIMGCLFEKILWDIYLRKYFGMCAGESFMEISFYKELEMNLGILKANDKKGSFSIHFQIKLFFYPLSILYIKPAFSVVLKPLRFFVFRVFQMKSWVRYLGSSQDMNMVMSF